LFWQQRLPDEPGNQSSLTLYPRLNVCVIGRVFERIDDWQDFVINDRYADPIPPSMKVTTSASGPGCVKTSISESAWGSGTIADPVAAHCGAAGHCECRFPDFSVAPSLATRNSLLFTQPGPGTDVSGTPGLTLHRKS
jgi:hypothetical protein